MTHRTKTASIALAIALSSCSHEAPRTAPPPVTPAPSSQPANPYEGTLSSVTWPGEKHISNVRQLTFAGENAEAYWSADGKSLIFQRTAAKGACDQIYTLDLTAKEPQPKLVSTGKGRTTCAYYFPDGRRVLYSSTHLGSPDCPKPPDRSQGYVWPLYPDYDLFTALADGSGLRRITTNPGYDAEATISTDGKRIVFTSARDADLDVYSMAPDGSDVRRLTDSPGYDGGPFFSDDGEWIVYRAARPKEDAVIQDFRSLLAKFLVRPGRLEIHVMRADGSDDRAVTENGVANFAPFFFRGGHDRIIFCSNLADPKGRNFDIWSVNLDGTGLERVTYCPTFDGFPMFSPDGKQLAFCSNRHNSSPGDTNVFVADWVP